MEVTAEGVENSQQLACLASMGCDKIQGYLASRPLGEAAFTEILAKYGRAPGLLPGLTRHRMADEDECDEPLDSSRLSGLAAALRAAQGDRDQVTATRLPLTAWSAALDRP